MLSFRSFLTEVHYSVVYGKKFEALRKYKNHPDAWRLYVQFTDHQPDTLHRVGYENPDHRDPVGIYAYPLKYVLEHPGDITYGSRAKFARVLLDTSKKKLVLNNINEYNFYSLIIAALGKSLSQIEDFIKKLKKFSPIEFTGKTKFGKLFFSLIQLDFSNAKLRDGDYRKVFEPEQRSGKEQTRLLRKLGYDAIEDVSANLKQAIINDREPEQICFLTRYAFKVVETVPLRGAYGGDAKGWVGTTVDERRIERPIVAMMCRIMNDKITTGPYTSNRGGWSHFYTKAGRRIDTYVEDTSLSWRMQNLKMGQKKHKMHKKSTPHQVKLTIHTEYGTHSLVFSTTDTEKDMLNIATAFWTDIQKKNKDPQWVPLNLEYEENKEKARIRKEFLEKKKKELEYYKKELIDNLDNLRFLEKHYQVRIPLPKPDQYERLLDELNSFFVATNNFIVKHFKWTESVPAEPTVLFEEMLEKLNDRNAVADHKEFEPTRNGFIELYEKIIQSDDIKKFGESFYRGDRLSSLFNYAENLKNK